RASGLTPSDFARASDMITVAAAPSLIGELFPAVTVPLAWNAGFSLARTSRLVSARGSSSLAKTKVCVVGLTDPPFEPTPREGWGTPDPEEDDAPLPLGTEVMFTSTAMVSSLKFPAATAASAFLCECIEDSSACSRVLPNLRAIFSVPSPILMYASG